MKSTRDGRDEPADQPRLSLRTVIRSGSTAGVTQLCVTPDGAWVCAAFDAIDMMIWSTQGGQLAALPETRGSRLALSADGQWLATLPPAGDGAVRVWNLPRAALVQTCHMLPASGDASPSDATTALAWHPDSAGLFLGTRMGKVWLWDRTRVGYHHGFSLTTLMSPGVTVTALAVSPQGTWLAAGRADGVIGIGELDEAREARHERIFPGRHETGVGGLYVAEGWFLVSQARDVPICRIWVPSGINPWVREWRLVDAAEATNGPYPVALDPLERWAYSATHLAAIQTWRYWRHPPADRLEPLRPPGLASDDTADDASVRVTALTVGARGTLLAAGDALGRIWLWTVS